MNQPETDYRAFRSQWGPTYSLEMTHRSVPPRKLQHHASRQAVIDAARQRTRSAAGMRAPVQEHYTEFREKMTTRQAEPKTQQTAQRCH